MNFARVDREVTPLRMSRPPGAATRAWRFLISSRAILLHVRPPMFFLRRRTVIATDASFQTHSQQLPCLNGEFHRQLAEDFLAEAVDDHADGIFQRDAAGLAIEELVFADLAGAGFVLGPAAGVAHFDIRRRVCAALVAQQQRVALRVVAAVGRRLSESSPGRDSVFCPWPALIPLETIVLLVFLPMWIIFVPVSACWRLLVRATE